MRIPFFILLATLLTIVKVQAQFVLDCACVAQHASLTVTNCQSTIPDICALTTNCFRGTIQPPPPLIIINCNQNPAVGTPVGPGTHFITVTVTVAGLAPMQCVVPFTVVAPITGTFGLQCAANKSVNCGTQWNFDPPTVVNPCCPNAALPNGGATISVVNDVTNGVCPMVITRTWKAVDQCGQSATCSQTVTVVDTVPPTLNCGPNQTVNCPTPWSFSTPTYSDNCTAASDMVLSIVSTVTNGVCPRVITRVWRVTDLCGNSATCTETVTIVDNVPPTITCGPNQTVNCGQQWNFSTPIISDNCTPVAGLVLNILSTTTNGACPEVVTRVWEVVDRCGNKATCTETVTIVDNTPPTITCAPSKQVPCGAQWNFDPPTATDNCAVGAAGTPNVTIAVVSTVTNSLCPLRVTRTWSATDACGNSSQCSQTVTVIGGPNSLTLNCAALAALPVLQTNACTGYVPDLCPRATALAQQLCPCPINCSQSPAAGTPYPPGTYPITITLSDGAGGSATCTVNFVVTAPAAGCNPCPPTLTAVLNTGTTNGNGGLLPTGSLEQVWVNVSAPGGPIPMVVFDTNLYPVFSGPWVPASATSAWVSPAVNGIGPVGLYTNRVIYNAKCDKVCLTGRIASDDDGYFYVNGAFVSGSGFTAWSNINHCANFVAGPNVIEFVVNNASQWTGFRTELEFYESCCCNTFTNVWNTGMDGTNALAVGQPDPNYVLVSAPPGCAGPAQVVGGIPGPWVPNGPNSQWIGGGPNANCDSGVYHYRVSFYLPCADGASVFGQWTADDFGAVHLNGQLLYSIPNIQNPYSFTGWHPLALTNGFVCGTNTLDFYVTNAHGVVNPTGFRAELTNIWDDCCCGPLKEVSKYHSGVNAAGLMPVLAPDPQLVLNCAPPGVATGPAQVTFVNPFWMPNGPDSQWLAPVGNPNLPGGLYCYTYRFTLPPCTNGTPKYAVKGQWMGDDAGTIFANGNPTGNNLPNGWAFTNWHPISITSGLVPGINFLTFYVTNASAGDTGIRVELTNYASCCDCVMTNCNVTITCPPNTNITSCAIVNGQLPVSYPLPTASSTCGTITSIVCVPPSGSPFPANTSTLVTCTATDANGHTASCSFAVTLTGVPPLAIICPPNITANSACGAACAVVTYPAPVVSNGSLVGCSPPSGTCFPIGSTIVTCRANNICNDRVTCTFTVTVLPFTLPCAPVPANLALWLPFDEASGLTAGNLAGGSTGALNNGPTHQLGSYVNNSLCFDGVNDYVQVANHTAIQFGTGDFSVDAWVKPATLSSSIRIIAEHRAEIGIQATGWSLFLGGNNGLAFQIGDGNYVNYPSTLTVPADGKWHLVAVTVNRANPNGIRFYVDGVIDPTPRDPTPYPGSVTPPANYPMRVSSRSSSLSGFFPGCIDEVELFRRALTPSEISAIYNAKSYGKCRPGSNGVVPPLVIKCPPDQTIFTCSNSATANFKPTASGNLGPIVCVPPSGTVFPVGTNTVTCSVTNICGATNWCSFKVVVKPYGPLSPFPSATYWAGTPDNYLGTTEPANVSACLNTAFSPVPFRAFDQIGNDRVLAHRFTGLPNNIVQAILVVRMKPSLTDPNSNNDGLFLGFGPVCNSSTYVYGNAIRLLPGAVPATGGTWVAGNNGSTTFTLNLGTLNPALLTKMNTDQYLDVAIHDDTIVDYMELRIWRCPPPHIGTGVPHTSINGTVLAAMAGKVLPGFGPIGVGPALCVAPPNSSINKVSAVEADLGGGESFSFTTILDMDAEDGATLEIVDPLDPMGVPLLTATLSRGTQCWDLKKCKGARSTSAGFRTTAVNEDGQLLGSFFQTLDEGNTNAAVILRPEDGVTAFPITITIHRGDGTLSVAFPGSAARPCCRPKGWDGTIKGRFNDDEALRKGWDGTIKGRPPGASMITFTPHAPHPVVAPQLLLYGTGMDEWLLTSEMLTTMGNVVVKKLTGALGFASPEDEQATDASWHQSTMANDGVSVVSLEGGGGVSLDVGHSEGFRIEVHPGRLLSDNDQPVTGSIAFRAIGNPLAQTNRPPPPVFDARFIRLSNDVIAAVDFSPLEATSIRVQLWSNGVLIAEGVNPGPAIAPEDAFSIGNPGGGMPNRISMNLTTGRALRLFRDEFFSVQGQDGTGAIIIVQGDEIRLTPEIPPGTEVPLYFTTLEYAGSEETEALLYDLQRTPYCGDTPPSLRIRKRPDLLTAEWDSLLDESLRLQGSEDLNGPWFELGGQSPYPVNTNTAAKFFRLICE